MPLFLTKKGTQVSESIHEGLNKVAGDASLQGVTNVVVKPNIGNPFHVDGVTTHAEVILPVVEWLRDRFADVAVVESDGIRYSCDHSFQSLRLTEAIPRTGARLVNLSRDRLSAESLIERGAVDVRLPVTLERADLVVSVPVIKSHELTTISCAIKNLFGCVPISNRIRLHPFLHDVLAELYAKLRPRLVVGDGLDVMEGNGPIHGEVKHANLLTFASSPLVHDIRIASGIFGLDWRKVRHLDLAQRRTQEDVAGITEIDEYGDRLSLRVPQLDLVARTMERTYQSQELISLLYLTPAFPVLNRLAWSYRAIFGRKPKFELHY